MKKLGIFYWPKGGNVEKAAQKIATLWDGYELNIYSLNEVKIEQLLECDVLIFGNSTVGAPNWELATDDNVYYKMFHQLETNNVDLSNRKVAFFSLGDQIKYPYHFVDSLDLVYKQITKFNAEPIGKWSNHDYDFKESKAFDGDSFHGLVLDLDNDPETLAPYAEEWVENLKKEI